MRKLRINFKSMSKDLVIENPKTIAMEPNVRVISIITETPTGMVNYTIPLEQINYMEDSIPVNMVIPANSIIKVPEVN